MDKLEQIRLQKEYSKSLKKSLAIFCSFIILFIFNLRTIINISNMIEVNNLIWYGFFILAILNVFIVNRIYKLIENGDNFKKAIALYFILALLGLFLIYYGDNNMKNIGLCLILVSVILGLDFITIMLAI